MIKLKMAININTYCRINRNGSININTDPRFGAPYSTNLIVACGGVTGAAILNVTIQGANSYIIQQGTFPVYSDSQFGNTVLYGHHFGGTSITVSEQINASITLSINGIPKEGDCNNPITGTYTWNYIFTENDVIQISSTDCGG
jgi:hypothetical protein